MNLIPYWVVYGNGVAANLQTELIVILEAG